MATLCEHFEQLSIRWATTNCPAESINLWFTVRGCPFVDICMGCLKLLYECNVFEHGPTWNPRQPSSVVPVLLCGTLAQAQTKTMHHNHAYEARFGHSQIKDTSHGAAAGQYGSTTSSSQARHTWASAQSIFTSRTYDSNGPEGARNIFAMSRGTVVTDTSSLAAVAGTRNTARTIGEPSSGWCKHKPNTHQRGLDH